MLRVRVRVVPRLLDPHLKKYSYPPDSARHSAIPELTLGWAQYTPAHSLADERTGGQRLSSATTPQKMRLPFACIVSTLSPVTPCSTAIDWKLSPPPSISTLTVVFPDAAVTRT